MTTAFIDIKIYLALMAKLNAMSGGYTIVEPGETYPTDPSAPFIAVDDKRFDSDRLYVGSDDDNNEGIFNLAVMMPLSTDHKHGLQVVGLIKSHFTKGVAIYYDGVRVKLTKSPQAGSAYRDDAFYRVPVMIYWRCIG